MLSVSAVSRMPFAISQSLTRACLSPDALSSVNPYSWLPHPAHNPLPKSLLCFQTSEEDLSCLIVIIYNYLPLHCKFLKDRDHVLVFLHCSK